MSRRGIPTPAEVVVEAEDYEALANIFARAYSETGSIADALRVYDRVRGHVTQDVGAVNLNEIIRAVAAYDDVSPGKILSQLRDHEVAVARYKCWWLARQRKLSFPAIAAAFCRDHSSVIKGLDRFEREMSAETRAWLMWTLAELRRPQGDGAAAAREAA